MAHLEAGLDKRHNWKALGLLGAAAEGKRGWFAACCCQHWAFVTIDPPDWQDLARLLVVAAAAAAAAASEVADSHYMGLGPGLGLHRVVVDSPDDVVVVVGRQAIGPQIPLCVERVELPQVDPIPDIDQTGHCYQQIDQIPAARSLQYAEHAYRAPLHHAHPLGPAAE